MSPKSFAGIVINPPVESDDLDRDMKIDQHLGEFGIKLSKKDMLSRYGRTEAADESDAAIRQATQPNLQGNFNGFANELKNKKISLKTPEASEPQAKAVLKAFAEDMGPASEAVAKLLKNPTPETAAALLDELSALLPDDPALATVIAEAMAEEFGVMLENTEQVPAGHANAGQFTGKTNPPTGTTKEPHDKGFQDNYGNGNIETLAANPKMNIERGKAVITHIMSKKEGFEPHALYRKDIGWIGVDYGTPGNANNKKDPYAGGHGISHVLAKHPGAIDGVIDILQNGTAYKHDKSKRKIFLIKDRTAVVLSKSRDNRLLITDFENLSDKQMREYTSNGVYHAKGEN